MRGTNRFAKYDMGILKGSVSCREIEESDEAKTSRASSGAVNGNGGIGDIAVLGEVVFENFFGGVAGNASYKELGSIRIHLPIHGYCTKP